MKTEHEPGTGPMRFAPGIVLCLGIAIPAWIAGKLIPVIGDAVFAILLGLVAGIFFVPGDRRRA